MFTEKEEFMSDESKKAYTEKLEAKLREWSNEFDRLKEKVGGSETKIREECHKIIEELRIKREDIKKRIREMKEASGETWEELKYGTDETWKEMKAAIDKIMSKIKHKTG
jgi:DNA anti-recombination protein RmuC